MEETKKESPGIEAGLKRVRKRFRGKGQPLEWFFLKAYVDAQAQGLSKVRQAEKNLRNYLLNASKEETLFYKELGRAKLKTIREQQKNGEVQLLSIDWEQPLKPFWRRK